MKSAFPCLALLALLLAFSSCSRLNKDNLEKIRAGMSEKEVIALIGKPGKEETGSVLDKKTKIFFYESGKNKAKITFINDAVTNKQSSWNQ